MYKKVSHAIILAEVKPRFYVEYITMATLFKDWVQKVVAMVMYSVKEALSDHSSRHVVLLTKTIEQLHIHKAELYMYIICNATPL